MVDSKLWGRVWDSFRSRRPLLGPKQFIRISTKVHPDQLEPGDIRLQRFLNEWLERVDYLKEMETWEKTKSTEEEGSDDE